MDADCWELGTEAGCLSVQFHCSPLKLVNVSHHHSDFTASSHSAGPVSFPDGDCLGPDGRRRDALKSRSAFVFNQCFYCLRGLIAAR